MTLDVRDDAGYRAAHRAHQPDDPLNGMRYHTGRLCGEPGCHEPAGTAWDPRWCQRHNAERLDRLGQSLAELGALLGAA